MKLKKILMKQQVSKSVTDQRLSSSNKRQPPQKVLVGSEEYGMLSAERSRNRKPASHCSLIYASSALTCLVRCEIDSEWPILDVSGQIQEEQRKGHPQSHHSSGHLTTMILSNDPRYGSRLARDQGQLSILQILIEGVSEGQLVGRTEMIFHMTSNTSIHETGTPQPKRRDIAQHWQPLKWVRSDRACDQAHSVVQCSIGRHLY
jgi:hypothetical protein